MPGKSRRRHLSVFAAWAFSFGTAVGWGSFVMPGTTFLPMSGPLGTVIGVVVGAAVMAVVAWNYHYLVRRMPGPGGTFTFVSRTFGGDHGFLCAWFLCLSYIAILWANATALTIVVRSLFGDVLHFGFHYVLAGYDVYLGDILLSAAAIMSAAAVCCRRSIAGRVQSVMAGVFAIAVAICFFAAVRCHEGGLQSMAPAFAQNGDSPLAQVLKIVALSPWFFVGFESICHLSKEFRFPLRRTFAVMAASLAASVLAYSFIALLPALQPLDGSGWTGSLSTLGARFLPTLEAGRAALGRACVPLFAAAVVGAVFTSLVGNMIVSSRLAVAMSESGAFPGWLGRRDKVGEPRNAILAVAGVSCLVPFLGRTAIGFIVDVATIGAVIAYAYTSASAYRRAGADNDRFTRATGAFGFALAAVICQLFILPNYFSGTMMAAESYLILVLWSILGFLYYLYVLKRDRLQRYGRSMVVWIGLVVLILFMSHMWIRQAAFGTMKSAFATIGEYHEAHCGAGAVISAERWNKYLDGQLSNVSGALVREGIVQVGLITVALAIMFSLFVILRRRERQLERDKAKARSYFFSTVSHDIRTPLNAIIGFSEMLKSGMKTEAERDQALESILVSGRTLLGLINDVLDLSKLESGKMKIALEPTDCQRLMREMVDAFRVTNGNPAVELRYGERQMPPLLLDPQRIRQIVFNLVGNALKFTEKGHVELRASYDRVEGSDVGVFRIDVEDTGCGISETDLKRLGNAYVQVESNHSRNGGTGLGLAICKQLAVAMGGRLKVDSVLGQGTTFSVVVPNVKMAPAEAVDKGETPAAPVENAAAAPVPDAAPERPKRILIVDDSKMNLMVLKALLKKHGEFEVAMAMDGNEALSILTKPGAEPFDLVLTDMWMPNLDGEGLVKAIRENPFICNVPVLVVTADVEMQNKSADMGFDGILLKPVTTAVLGKALSGRAQ